MVDGPSSTGRANFSNVPDQIPLRVATEADRPIVVDLVQRAAEGLAGRRGGDALLLSWLGDRDPSEALSALEEAVSPSLVHVVLHEPSDGLSLAWTTPYAGEFAVWVDPSARHQGAGPQLAQTAIAWLEDQGATEIDALALPGDREMKNVLERAGFKARLLTLRRSG